MIIIKCIYKAHQTKRLLCAVQLKLYLHRINYIFILQISKLPTHLKNYAKQNKYFLKNPWNKKRRAKGIWLKKQEAKLIYNQ